MPHQVHSQAHEANTTDVDSAYPLSQEDRQFFLYHNITDSPSFMQSFEDLVVGQLIDHRMDITSDTPSLTVSMKDSSHTTTPVSLSAEVMEQRLQFLNLDLPPDDMWLYVDDKQVGPPTTGYPATPYAPATVNPSFLSVVPYEERSADEQLCADALLQLSSSGCGPEIENLLLHDPELAMNAGSGYCYHLEDVEEGGYTPHAHFESAASSSSGATEFCNISLQP